MSKKILFVGAFNQKNYKNIFGGQLFACSSIMESDLVKKHEIITIDSTQRNIPPPKIPTRIYDSILRFYSLIKNLSTNKIDILLIFTSDGLGFIEKGLMVIISKIFSVRTILYPRSGFIKNDVKNSFFRFFLKLVLRNTDLLMVQGNSWKLFFEKFSKKTTKILVQQNWIDNSKFSFPNRDFNINKLNILFMGWVDINKGIFDLVQVFSELILKDNLDNIKLTIAGNGKDFYAIKNKIQDIGIEKHVDMVGWVDNSSKIKLLKNSDIYVHPSYFEGFPNSLLESLSMGIPSVCTDVGSIPDIIKSGYNGFIFEPGDRNSLKKYLIKLINDKGLRKIFSSNSIKYVKMNNSIDSSVKNLDNIFNKIVI